MGMDLATKQYVDQRASKKSNVEVYYQAWAADHILPYYIPTGHMYPQNYEVNFNYAWDKLGKLNLTHIMIQEVNVPSGFDNVYIGKQRYNNVKTDIDEDGNEYSYYTTDNFDFISANPLSSGISYNVPFINYLNGFNWDAATETGYPDGIWTGWLDSGKPTYQDYLLVSIFNKKIVNNEERFILIKRQEKSVVGHKILNLNPFINDADNPIFQQSNPLNPVNGQLMVRISHYPNQPVCIGYRYTFTPVEEELMPLSLENASAVEFASEAYVNAKFGKEGGDPDKLVTKEYVDSFPVGGEPSLDEWPDEYKPYQPTA